MNADLTVGIFRNIYCIFILLNDSKEKCIGGGNLIKSTAEILQCIKEIQGSVLAKVKFGNFFEPIWMVPLRCHSQVAILLELKHVIVKCIPSRILNIMMQPRNTDIVNSKKLELLSVYQKLRCFQKCSVEFMIRCGGRAINASEMGTGKTATAICMSQYYDNVYPQLIVCPSSLKHNWKSEFSQFAGIDVPIIKNGNEDFSKISIISYSLLSSKKIAKKLIKFQLIILDESHYIKSASSQRSKMLIKLAKDAKKVILLTGTPSSKPIDLYTQLKAIDPHNFSHFFPFQGRIKEEDKDQFYFANRYCKPTKVFIGNKRFHFKFDGSDRSWELHALLTKYMTRKTKNEVLRDLPPKLRERLVIDELSISKKKSIQKELDLIEQIKHEKGTQQGDFHLMELVRETASLKIKSVITYINYIIDRQDSSKYLIFAHHRIMLDAIIDLMTKHKQSFISIDGRTKTDERQGLVDAFQNDSKKIKFAVLSIRAAGVGLNLFKANVVIFCELLWSEKDHIQSEDRAHRQNQQNTVFVKYLILSGSTDDIMWRSLSRKITVSGAILDNKRSFLRADIVAFQPNNQKIAKY
jgi:SWI/SNF-related matrix-associated actin-dependent regulator 1 of chromatin subfamily A